MPTPRVVCHLAILMATAVLAEVAPAGAADEPYWQQSFPQLADPTPEFRPKVRSRPQGHNLEALAAAGFGGVEIGLDFRAEPQVAQQELHAQLQEAQRLGMHLDLAPGGSQPYESPGISEADSMQQLVTVSVSVQGGTDYAAVMSQPAGLAGQARLVAVSAARVADDSKTPVVLAATSVIDLTRRLDRSGVLHWHVPDGRWLLFSYWQRATGQVFSGNPFEEPSVWSGRVPQTGPGRYFTADLFSSAGISSALSYLDAHILRENLALVRGGNLAHDSLEVQAQMFWTGDLPQQFRQRRGYSIIPYLPGIYTPGEASFNPLNPAWAQTLPPRPFEFDDDTGARVRYDYQRTLTDLYAERYLRAFSDWAHSRGLRSRVQVAYNYLALDMLRSARYVDIPENESFDPGWAKAFDPTLPAYGSERWRHVMDSYRLTGSGAHLAGVKRATVEFGDDFAIYRKQPVDYAQQLNESLAGGITMGLLTEFNSASTEWPTPQGGAAMGLGDAWTAGWPQWRDWPALSRYFARSTQVLESGQARIDVAIYHDRGLSTVHDGGPLFASDRMERAGYTYDFIDPLALSTMAALATPGVLYGHGVGYRALILDRQMSMPLEAALAILSLAQQGLPVVVIGVPPRISTGLLHHARNDQGVERAMTAMMRRGNAMHVESADEVPGALQRLGCLPSASFGDRSPLLSVHRQTAEQDLWWIFNPTDTPVATPASFAASGAPYRLDLWSGVGERVAQWSVAGQRMIVPLIVMPHATTVLLVHRGEQPRRHVISSSAEQIIQHADDLLVVDSRGGAQRLVLSDAQVRTVDIDGLPRPLGLSHWHLHVDEALPSGAPQHDLDLVSLADWRSLPELKDAVGQALYTAVINLPSQWFGADRESILTVAEVAGAMQLSVNGHMVSEQTTGYGSWPVGQWLRPGDNSLTIRLDTTLLNRMAALRAAGDARYQTGPTPLPTAASGLIGPVTLISAARLPLRASPPEGG
jgi:alpha-L-rhamnosidase